MRRPPITLYYGPQVSVQTGKDSKDFFFQSGSRVGAKALNLCGLRFCYLIYHACLPCFFAMLVEEVAY